MNESQDKTALEDRVHALLRDLPPRKAPASLRPRVMAELLRQRTGARATHASFATWPMWLRALFVPASTVLAFFALAEFERALSSVQANSLMASLAQIGRWFEIAGSVVVIVTGSASSVWIYGGLAAIAATYVVLFGVTAIAYRTLFSVRP